MFFVSVHSGPIDHIQHPWLWQLTSAFAITNTLSQADIKMNRTR